MPQFVTFECHCGHTGTVQMPDGPWLLRGDLIHKARCTVCGRIGAKDLRVVPDPGKLWDGKARPGG